MLRTWKVSFKVSICNCIVYWGVSSVLRSVSGEPRAEAPYFPISNHNHRLPYHIYNLEFTHLATFPPQMEDLSSKRNPGRSELSKGDLKFNNRKETRALQPPFIFIFSKLEHSLSFSPYRHVSRTMSIVKHTNSLDLTILFKVDYENINFFCFSCI